MYTFNARVRYSEVDRNGFLSPLALLDYFQDCATFHSEDSGAGLKYLAERKIAWLLNSWQVDIKEMPFFGTEVLVSTFAYDFKGCFGYRNFVLKDTKGNELALANSIWSLINMEKAKPYPVSKELADAYGIHDRLDMEYTDRKLKAYKDADVRTADSIVIGLHNLDTNNHVNNSQYVSMASDYITKNGSGKKDDDNKIKRIRAEYRKQAFLGDVMIPHICEEDNKILVMFKDESEKAYANVEFTLAL